MNERPAMRSAAAVTAVVLAAAVDADVRVSRMFTDHLVLQQGARVPVWGAAEPDEQVTVRFAGQVKKAAAGEDGKWTLRLDPMAASREGRAMQISGSNTVSLADVLVGEVWFAGGQSNMEMPVGNKIRPRVYPGVLNFQEEIRQANHPMLRLLKVDRQFASRPLDRAPTRGWKVCTPESVEVFSAVAYFFGRYLVQHLDTPVGMIASACSSSVTEQWTSIDALERFPQFAEAVDFYRHADHERLRREWWDRGRKGPRIAPKGQPSALFNGGLAPVIPYAIRGAIWYQGESNAGRAAEYRQLLPNMIADWRKRWGQGDFPFYQVQLAGRTKVTRAFPGPNWPGFFPELREAQRIVSATVPNVDMIVGMDIGMPDFIHPLNKQEFGRRLGLLAHARTYGADIEYSGPRYRSMDIVGSRAVLHFDHVAGGLVSRNREKPRSVDFFAVAGKDRVWHWADAVIDGDTVVVCCAEVPNPVAVRYGWAANINCEFYNKAGLPAVPFRTDNWPLMSGGKLYDVGDDFRRAWREIRSRDPH